METKNYYGLGLFFKDETKDPVNIFPTLNHYISNGIIYVCLPDELKQIPMDGISEIKVHEKTSYMVRNYLLPLVSSRGDGHLFPDYDPTEDLEEEESPTLSLSHWFKAEVYFRDNNRIMGEHDSVMDYYWTDHSLVLVTTARSISYSKDTVLKIVTTAFE